MRRKIYLPRLARALSVSLACAAIALMAGNCNAKSPQVSRTSATPSRDLAIDASKPARTADEGVKIGPDLGKDLPFFSRYAELEASYIEFKADFHFGVDQWFNHRVEAEITNLDTIWYGGTRQWQIYSFPSFASPYGIQLVDQGTIPLIAPGETYRIKTSLPASVDFQAGYALILSAGDANSQNDIAVDSP